MKMRHLFAGTIFLVTSSLLCMDSDRIHNDRDAFASQLRRLSSNQGILVTSNGRMSVVTVHPDWVTPYRHTTESVQMVEDSIRSNVTGESFLDIFRSSQNRLRSVVILNTGRILPGGDTPVLRFFFPSIIDTLLTDPSGHLRSRLSSAFLCRLQNELHEKDSLAPLMRYIGPNCHIYKRYENGRLSDVIAAINNNQLLMHSSSDHPTSIAHNFEIPIKIGLSSRNQLIEQFSDATQSELATHYQDLFGKIANATPTFRE